MRVKLVNIVVVTVVVALFGVSVWSCDNGRFTIDGRISAAPCEMIYLAEYISSRERVVVDSVKVNDLGEFSFVVANPKADPVFYELRCGLDEIYLSCKAGDAIKVTSTGEIETNYTVEGSEDSQLVRDFIVSFNRNKQKLSSIAANYGEVVSDSVKRRELGRKYHDLYRQIKREQLEFIIENKGTPASLMAITMRLDGDTHLFTPQSDLIYLRMISEEYRKNYPNSRYTKLLAKRIADLKNSIELAQNVTVSDFPELNLPNMHGERKSLSSLKGRVILIDFWDVGKVRGNQNNAELKELYRKFSSSGLEIYQVGVTDSKALWVSSIQAQRLPWVCVSDLTGAMSPALSLYNVTRLPANIIIDKNSQIAGLNLYDNKLRELVESLCSQNN